MASKKAGTLAVPQNSQDLSVHQEEVLAKYGDGSGLPFDLRRYENLVCGEANNMLQAALRMGGYLIVIREHIPQGDWLESLQRMEIPQRAAYNAIGARLKLDGKHNLLAAAKNKSKAIELLVMDSDDLEVLEEGGTVAGLDLDEIDRMSTRELRKALREAREEGEAKDQVIADKNKKLDELDAKKRRIKKVPPDEESEQIRREAADHCFQAEVQIRNQMRHALLAVQEHAREHNIDVHSFIGGQLNQIEDALLEAREELCVYREEAGWAEDVSLEEEEA